MDRVCQPGGHIRHQQVLVGCKWAATTNRLDHAPHAGAQPAIRTVADAAVLDEHAEERASDALGVPTEMILDVRDFHGGGSLHRSPPLTFYLPPPPAEPLPL